MRKKKLFKTTLTEKDIIFDVLFRVKYGYHSDFMHKDMVLRKAIKSYGYFDGVQCFDGWTPKIVNSTPMVSSDDGFLTQEWMFKANIHGIWRWIVRVPENVGMFTYINDEVAYNMTEEELLHKLNRKPSSFDAVFKNRGRFGCGYSLQIVIPDDIIADAVKRIFGRSMNEIDNPDHTSFIKGKLVELDKQIDNIYRWIEYLKQNDTSISLGHVDVKVPHFEIDFRQLDMEFKD